MIHLTIEMEGEVQIVQMEEDVLSQFSDRMLGHLGEDRVTKFVEAGRATSVS